MIAAEQIPDRAAVLSAVATGLHNALLALTTFPDLETVETIGEIYFGTLGITDEVVKVEVIEIVTEWLCQLRVDVRALGVAMETARAVIERAGIEVVQ